MSVKKLIASMCLLIVAVMSSLIYVGRKDVYAYDTHMVEVQTRLKELGYYDGEINGAYEMQSVKIDPSVVDADDVEMLEDLVVAAYNDAKTKIDDKKNSSLGAFGGLI